MLRLILRLLPISLLAVGLIDRPTLAEDLRRPFGYRIGSASSSSDHCCWLVNDYCRKPEPPVPCQPAGCGRDCFARKPLPPVPCVAGCASADDYVRKCYPRPPGQCATPGLPRKIYAQRGY